MTNVNLAIRVRPFTDKEIRSERDRIQVVHVVDDRTVTITNMKVSVSGAGDSRERVRRYHADFTFDSACARSQPSYSSQEKVFDTIGRQVLDNISRGSSACVLAYGQSATGKTHTMMGTDTQPGLIPRICRALAEEQLFGVSVSFLEIYNERVHDLLVGEPVTSTCHSLPRRKGNERKNLRVREHPTRGPYVQNLRRVAVHDVESLLSLVSEGARRRRTAATRRNSTSSRSHALLELATPRATLHLADLAGSEKASWEGCGGGRQKEGANINKSLVALSNVISALVSGGRGGCGGARGGRGRYVPYRDSALTWLLKDCFTGGALTFIIATVSPSISCYGESASTLRWAERARHLPITRASNALNAPSRAALQAQFNQLLTELENHFIKYVPETGKIYYDDNHWILINKDNKTKLLSTDNTEVKIGNIMSISYPKTDAHNSESAPSSVASGSSDVLNVMDKNIDISDEINKEVDKIFGPTLERTRSGSDLKVISPDKNTRRQYKSQELPVDKTLQLGHTSHLSDVTQSLSEVNIDEAHSTDEDRNCPVNIIYDNNNRADIVASVTERLYSKLKKKELPIAKVESAVDKRVPQSLSELRICTNARQRLIELSQKALRNKRRIGIPVHTQTRKNVIRVKDQEIDTQNDLESYVINKKRSFLLYRDVSTETTPITPRYKEVAVGPSCGSLHVRDQTTSTENKKVPRVNSITMTDVVKRVDFSTQTPILQPTRRKKRASIFSRLLKKIESNRNTVDQCPASPVININISPSYQEDSESSEDNQEKNRLIKKENNSGNSALTPDLLTNHSNADKEGKNDEKEHLKHEDTNVDDTDESILIFDDREASQLSTKFIDDFPDMEENILPRVVVSPSNDPLEIKDMILGRSVNSYPYNIALSPIKQRDETRKMIRFKEIDITPAECCNMKLNNDANCNYSKKDWMSYEDSRESLYSDCSTSSKLESEPLSWRKARCTNQATNTSSSLKKKYLAVPKSNIKYKIARAKLYKEFLGLERDLQLEKCHKCSPKLEFASSDNAEDYINGSQDTFKQRRQFFENKFSRGYYPQRDTFSNIERKIINSCNKLELSTNRYEDFLNEYKENKFVADRKEIRVRTPTEYLQHLVQLRREAIQANIHRNESFV